jgi:hypothetical protein
MYGPHVLVCVRVRGAFKKKKKKKKVKTQPYFTYMYTKRVAPVASAYCTHPLVSPGWLGLAALCSPRPSIFIYHFRLPDYEDPRHELRAAAAELRKGTR